MVVGVVRVGTSTYKAGDPASVRASALSPELLDRGRKGKSSCSQTHCVEAHADPLATDPGHLADPGEQAGHGNAVHL